MSIHDGVQYIVRPEGAQYRKYAACKDIKSEKILTGKKGIKFLQKLLLELTFFAIDLNYASIYPMRLKNFLFFNTRAQPSAKNRGAYLSLVLGLYFSTHIDFAKFFIHFKLNMSVSLSGERPRFLFSFGFWGF